MPRICRMLTISRREALPGKAGTDATILISGWLGSPEWARGRSSQHSDASVSAWVRISPDNSVTLVVSQSEIGQGTSTTLASILDDELYVPLPRVRIEFAPVAPVYREPSTYSVKMPLLNPPSEISYVFRFSHSSPWACSAVHQPRRHACQLNFDLSAIDARINGTDDAPAIGLLLCLDSVLEHTDKILTMICSLT